MNNFNNDDDKFMPSPTLTHSSQFNLPPHLEAVKPPFQLKRK